MTLDEAIKHAEEVAKKQENNAKIYPRPDRSVRGSGKKYNTCLKCAEEHRQLVEWLKELKQLREQTRWIPCTERLPEEDGLYLVYTEEQPFVCPFENGDFFIDNVIAWMSLPQPYKAESEE